MAHRRRREDRRRSSSSEERDGEESAESGRSEERRSRSAERSPRRRQGRRDERRDRDRGDRDRSERRRRRSPDSGDSEGDRRRGRPPPPAPPPQPLSDWYCRCGALNFKRRNACYRQHCAATRAEATGAAAGGAGITKRLALSGLDARSDEESVVGALRASAPAAAARLVGVALAPPGSGACHLTYATVADAMDAYGALLAARLRIDGRKIAVAYQPETWGGAVGVAPPTAIPPVPSAAPAFTVDDVPRMAEYSARLYAKDAKERAEHLKYYTAYYTGQLSSQPTEADRVNAAAAVAQSAISQLQARATPFFSEDRVYPAPDASAYVYDESSGYYYDRTTGLYYDASSQYYYDGRTGRYLYWNPAKMTYSPAPTGHEAAGSVAAAAAAVAAAASREAAESEETADDKKRPPDKQDKNKVAKKIAKDMERWAKTLNQKKDTVKGSAAAEAAEAARAGAPSGSADIGFSVLESRAPVRPGPKPQNPNALVPSYGAGSESSGEEEEPMIDPSKIACLLCKRQFPTKEALEKHCRLSDLHRKNLEEHRKKKRPKEFQPVYRDRAAERRLKFGEDDPPPPPGRPAGPPEPAPRPAVPAEIGEENVGNRLLQKMGWSAGQGLGREGQGRVGPLEARAGPPGAGLGQKRGIYTAGPGETYRDCVKKLMIARYQDLVENEANS